MLADLRSLVVIAALVVVTLASPARAQSTTENVTFPSLGAQASVVLTAALYHPTGAGPFPAMVLLHTCSGIAPYEGDWAKWFAERGYLALVVDSFGPRGVRNVCGGGEPNMRARAFDAYAALGYLRARTDVVPARVGAIGWSHGAGTTVLVDNTGFLSALRDAAPAGGAFRAAIALYPPCQTFANFKATNAPLLLLAGTADDWTPPTECMRAVAGLGSGAFPVTTHLYDGATHAFDNPRDRGRVKVGPHVYTLTYDPQATADAHARVADFLADTLK
jgi:dienelactone hydrolase